MFRNDGLMSACRRSAYAGAGNKLNCCRREGIYLPLPLVSCIKRKGATFTYGILPSFVIFTKSISKNAYLGTTSSSHLNQSGHKINGCNIHCFSSCPFI